MTPRERLAETTLASRTFDSLEDMSQAYAAEAVRSAPRDLRPALDYTAASIPTLERILDQLCPPPQPDQDYLTRLWGSYFGETLRHQFGGEWSMSVYPGSDFAVPTLDINGSRLYPMLKVFRRLTLGPSEDLLTFHRLVSERLTAASPSKPQ